MKALILCGGFGTRLSSIISDRPKPLAPIAGKPFLEHAIHWLARYSYREIIFSMHHRAEMIRKFVGDGSKFGIKPIFIEEDEAKGTGGAVKYALENIDKRIGKLLIVNGDTYFNVNLKALRKFHLQNKAQGTIALSNVLDVSRYGEVLVDEENVINEFVEKPKVPSDRPRAGVVNGGVYLLSKPALEKLKTLDYPFSIEKDFFSKEVKKGKIFGYSSDTTHFDIGTPSGYRQTERYLRGKDEIVIRSRAPLRVSFGGGGTDVPPFDELTGGCVLNGTINRYVYGLMKLRDDKRVRMVSADYRKSVLYDDVRKLPEDGHLDLVKAIIKRMDINYGFELSIRSDVPPHSGLGSSASVAVAVIGLFNHLSVEYKLTKSQIAELAYQVETEDLENIGGRQDQYAAVYGGFNLFEFLGGDMVKVSPVSIDKSILMELERNLVLAYVGSRGTSGEGHKKANGEDSSKQKKKRQRYLYKMKELGYESYYALHRPDLTRFGTILDETWKLKKRAFKGSSTKEINKLYGSAKRVGAIGGRVTGVGGGGHMVFYCQVGKEHLVANRLQKLGAKVLDFGFDMDGLQTWEV